MKKLLLIPTIATTAVAPIITITSCSKPIEWIEWDFAQDIKYVHDQIKPLSKATSYKDAIKEYFNLIKQDKNNIAYESFLSLSKSWQESESETKVRTFWYAMKINDITFVNEHSILASYEVKLDQDYIIYDDDGQYLKYVISFSLVCENIPLQIKYFAEGREGWWIATPIDRLYDSDEVKAELLKDKKFHITGSYSYFTEDESGIGWRMIDPACDYSCKTIEAKWSTYERFIQTSYKSLSHNLYYLQNINPPPGE